jgi:flagellar biosynthesis protein FlhB
MADKTEKPTPKKLKEARDKGQIPKSSDLTQAALFLVAGAMLSGWGPSLLEQLKKFMIDSFDAKLLSGPLDGLLFAQRISDAGLKFLLLMIPFLASLMVAAIAVNFAQTQGLLFSPAALSPKFSKLNPVAALQSMFLKPKAYIELVKTLLKFVIIAWLAYSTLMPELRDLILSSRIGMSEVASFAPMLLFKLLFKVGGAFLVFGAADFAIQKKLYMNELMMSKEEIKQEYKEQEGDPHLKGERKHLQRKLLQEAAAKRVPEAKAVIVNPTHIAVAIEYDEQIMNAPRLAAKGQLQMAKRIVEIAKKHQVPVIRNIPLARSLFTLELDQEVPEDLYEAVAEILNFVAKLENTNESQ